MIGLRCVQTLGAAGLLFSLPGPARAAGDAPGTNAPPSAPAVSSPAASNTTATAPSTNTVAEVEAEYERLLEQDQDTLDEIDGWIQAEQAQATQGAGVDAATMRTRILDRMNIMRRAYDAFLARHPDHARGHLAYGSFLMEMGEEDDGVRQMEKARTLDPSNPAAWNNLANYYGHRGPVQKAFEFYAKAIELNPREPVYVQNLATTVFLFRADARHYYQLDEPAVFAKSLDLYRQALRLDPTNFVLATDYALTYYGIHPATNLDVAAREAETRRLGLEAIGAWEGALKLATDDSQRQGVHIHLARVNLGLGRTSEARGHLDRVTLDALGVLKRRILKNLEAAAGASPAPSATTPPGTAPPVEPPVDPVTPAP